jgi:hypothetical protein
MSETKISSGISKTTFIVGLLIAIVLSSAFSTLIALQFAKGPKGDKGDKGDTGPLGPVSVFAQWDVHWKTITGDYKWGGEVGTSKFAGRFYYNWGGGPMFSGYSTYIGFVATMQIKMQRDGPVNFIIGSDDSSWLYLDGVLIIDNGGLHPYQTRSILKSDLSQGFHTLTLSYIQVTGGSEASFDCDSDLLVWSG